MSALPSLPQASSPDYWQLAFDSLETKLKAKLNSTRTGKRDIPNAVLNAAEEKRNLCLRKAWRFEKPNGEVVIIREVIEKISKWVEKFKEVGDNAVQYDTAHASLPWAGVRFLLLLSFNEAKIFGTMAENLAIVSRLITCGKAYESLYLPHQAGANDQMQQCLIQFYATILEFLAKAIRFYQDSTLSRVIKSVIRNVEDPQMQRILDKESELLKLAQLKNMEALIDITSLTKSIFDRTKMTEKALEEQQYQELLRWLSTVNISAIHEDAYDHRISGTGEWFLKNHEYKQWRSSTSSSILVLHGIPGCGKTVLTAIVVEEFITERRTDPTVSPFAYFYCANSKTEWERSQPVEILRSIVKQLTLPASLYPKARSIVLSEYDRTKAQCNAEGSDMTKPRIEKCVSLILDVAMDDPLTIVIDAIDEVEVDLQHELLNALRQIVTDSNNVVRVMVTTRNQGHILKLLPGAVKVGISSQHNHHDVHQYTRILLEDKRNQGKLEISPDLEARITEVLLSEAKEMFLWIKLQVDHFCRMKTEKDIENAMIGRKFVQLNELYTDLLTAMLVAEPVARQIAVDTISWLLYAKEPLTSDALGSAIIPTNVGPVNMPEICMNLIRLDNSSSVFRFSHYSVQEFLRTQDIFAKHSANQRLAIQCLRVCVMGPSDRSYPIGSLFRYCAIYWGYHYKRAVCLDEPGKMLQHAKSFIYDEYGNQSLSFLSWLDSVKQISDAFDRDHPQKIALEAIQCPDQAPLFTASVFGLSDIFDYITSISHDKHDWDQKNLIGQTSLYLAAAFGHDTIVSSLISRGADYDIHCGRQGSPMAAACFAGHQNVVQVLLGAGVSIKPCGRFSSAIESTFRGDNESLALYLLKHAYRSLDQETYDSIALSASQAGFLEVIRYLHTPGMMASLGKKSSAESQLAQITSTIRIGDVASLEWKINKSNKPPLSILPPDGLANAALYGQEKMVEFLLQIGLSVEAEGLFGSPLRAASLMNHERIVVQLLNGGAKIRAHSVLGDALQAAARKGHAKLAQFLIDEGADPNLDSGPYGNALQAAAYHGHVEVVQSLLDANADIYQEGFREDACHAAAEGGREEIVSLLIRRGYKFRDRLRGPQAHMPGRSRYKQLIRNASPSYRAQSQNLCPDLGPCIQLSTEECNYAESSFETTFQAMREPGLMTKKSVIEPYRHSRLEENDILDLLVRRPMESTSTETQHPERSELKPDLHSKVGAFFIEAARTGETNLIKHSLHTSVDFTAHSQEAIRSAAAAGRVDIVIAILESTTALGAAAPMIELLLCSGHVSLVQRGLSLASSHFSSCEILDLRVKALITIINADAELSAETFKTMELLTTAKPPFDVSRAAQSFRAACFAGDLHAVIPLWNKHGQQHVPESDLAEGLCICAAKGHYELVRFLVNWIYPSDCRTLSEDSMIFAAGNGHLEVVRLLYGRVERSEDSRRGNTASRALTAASQAGHPAVVRFLTAAGTDPNALVLETLPPCTEVACPHFGGPRSPQVMNSLQACLLNFSRFDPGETAKLQSYLSSRFNHHWNEGNLAQQEEVLEQLLHHGADINAPVGCHDRALASAARDCTATGIKRLIEKGMNLSDSNSDSGLLQIVVGREISANPILTQLLDAGAILPTTKGRINDLLDKVLSYFVGDSSRQKFHTDGDPDGRFLQSQSLRDVFDEGPGAVVQTLLSCLQDEKAYDARYGLVLQMAALLNRNTMVKLLLERGVDVNATGYYYGTALQAASRCGHTNIVRLLLEAGADVNICQGRHHTALRAAVLSNDVATVGLLIEAGADVENDIEDQVHPLITACGKGDTRLATLLLDAGAPVDVSGRKVQYHHSIPDEDASPLSKASSVADVEMVRLLLSRGADAQKVVDHSRPPLVVAARAGSPLVVHALLAAGGGTQLEIYNIAVIEAASNGHLEALRELLHHGVDLTAISHAIVPACKARHFRVIEALIDNLGTFDDNSKNPILQNALEEVSKLHDAKVYDVMLEYSTTIDADYLVRACTAGSLLGIQIAIDEGIPIDSEDTQGRLGLHAAAYHLESSVVQYLIQHGANVGNIHPLYGSPLVAALEGCLETPLAELERLELAQKDPQRNPRNRSRLSSGQDRRNAEELLIRSQQPMLSEESKGGSEGSRRRRKIRQRMQVRKMGPGYEKKPGPSYHQFYECEKIAHSLIDAGAPCDTEFGRFGNALHLAAFLGSDTIVKLLLDRGASINACGGFFGSALRAALEGKRSSVVEILLSKGATAQWSTDAGTTPLQIACTYGSVEDISSLINAGADVNAKVTEAMLKNTRRSDGMKILLNHHPICTIIPSIMEAQRDWRCIELLMAHDHDVRLPDTVQTAEFEAGYAFEEAAEAGRLGIVQFFLRCSKNLMPHSRRALENAACAGHDEVVEALLDFPVVFGGTNVNPHDRGYDTALQMASKAGHDRVVKRLLDHAADVNFTGHESETALISATIRGHRSTVQVLLAQGADVNVQDRDHRKTALHWAAERGWDTIVQSLLEQGPSLSVQDTYGETPLHYACETGHLKIVQMLVEFGSSMEILDFVDRTPISCAQQNNHTKVTDWLTSR